MISANCFKGHFVSAFYPIIPSAMAFGQNSAVVTGSSGLEQQRAASAPSWASLPPSALPGGGPLLQTPCFPWLLPQSPFPAPPPSLAFPTRGLEDSQAPFSLLVRAEQPFPRTSQPWRGHCGLDPAVAQQPPPCSSPVLSSLLSLRP